MMKLWPGLENIQFKTIDHLTILREKPIPNEKIIWPSKKKITKKSGDLRTLNWGIICYNWYVINYREYGSRWVAGVPSGLQNQ